MFSSSVHGEEGEVTSIQGNKAIVKIQATKGCERCRLCTRISDTEMTIQANTIKPVNIGDRVILGFRPGIIIQSAFILYLLPLIALVVGYYVGKFLINSLSMNGREELIPALLSLTFLFATFVPIRFYDRKKKEDRRFQVYIKESLS